MQTLGGVDIFSRLGGPGEVVETKLLVCWFCLKGSGCQIRIGH